jgi:hypothetical protein
MYKHHVGMGSFAVLMLLFNWHTVLFGLLSCGFVYNLVMWMKGLGDYK